MKNYLDASNSGSTSKASTKQVAYLTSLQRQHVSRARRTDPVTSRLASRKFRHVTDAQQRILDAITAYGPMTDSELEALASTQRWEYAGRTYYRRRRSELSKMNLLRATGRRRQNQRGNTEMVWDISAPNELTWALTVDAHQLTKAQASRAITIILQSRKHTNAGNASTTSIASTAGNASHIERRTP